MSKLDELCATEVMDWALNIEMFPGNLEYAVWVNLKDNSPTLYYDHISQSIWRDPQFVPIASKQWRPETDLNDALLCLERVAGEAHWELTKRPADNLFSCWFIDIPNNPDKIFDGRAHTASLAMCLCALRASGVPESLITQAMEATNE